MNPVSQFDVHPDAESLNGFVEHQLPEAERAQVLEHLASCSRCRQIVYLTQDAALPAPAPAPARVMAAEHHIEDGEHTWILRSRTAWAAAFAFALLAAAAVFLSIRHNSTATEVAKFAPGVGPSLAAVAPHPPAAETAQSERSAAPVKSLAGNPEARRPRPAPTGSVGSILYEVAPARPALPPVAQPQPGTSVPQVTAEARSATEPLGLTAVGAPKSSALHGSVATRDTRFQSLGGPVDRNGLAPVAKNESAPQPASATVEVNADQMQLRPETTSRAQLETFAPPAGAAEEKKSGLTLLPSGLPVVSMAAAGRNIVAIDAVGSLFLSRDLEKSWEPVERQWTGQAVRVRIVQVSATPGSLGSFAAHSASPQAKASIAAPVPDAVFELVNDSNAVWTSADGKTWKAK